MSNVTALSLLTYFSETTAGTGPADDAAWISNGIRMRHLASDLDMSGVERVQLEDMRNQSRVFANEARVEGIDNPEFPFAVYGHGLGGSTTSGQQAATTLAGYELVNLLGHAMGGVGRGYANAVTGAASTTTTVDVTDASNHVVGDFIAIEFQTAVTGYAATTCFIRRITAIDDVSNPNVLTIDQALPQAPEDGDEVHACMWAYIDQDVLADSSGASGRTRSWLVQKGLPGSGSSVRESWEFNGCVAELQQMSLARGGLLQFAFRVMAGSHQDPTDAPWPTAWSSNAELGLAPLSITPITTVWLVDDGSTTNTLIHVSKFDVEPGVPRTRNEVITTNTVGMMGTASYGTQPADTLVRLAIHPFGIAQWTEQQAGTEKTLRWQRHGPVGSCCAIHFPRLSHAMTPKRAANNATTDVEIQFVAHEEEGLGTTEAQQSKMLIVFA